MKFITPKTSETGKRLSELFKRVEDAKNIMNPILKELNAEKASVSGWYIIAPILGVQFDAEPDMKIWKRNQRYGNLYSPRKNTKAGKEIQAKFDTIPKVERREVDQIIGNDNFGKSCGYEQNKTHFGFSINDNWEVTIPEDLEEVTTTQYKKIFPDD